MSKRSSSILQTLGGLAAAGAAAAAAYAFIVRPWHLRWGATPDEAERPLPGDDLVPGARLVATHAVTIQAPPGLIWPWLTQIGQGRGGFYSYEVIENRMMGLDIQNTSRILPEHQNLKVGDKIPLTPDGFGIPVAILDLGRSLVMHGDTRLDPATIPTMKPGDYFAASWGWYLFPVDDKSTRLIERFRSDWNDSPQNFIFMRVFLEPGAFLMERKMLLGIKQRAEQAH